MMKWRLLSAALAVGWTVCSAGTAGAQLAGQTTVTSHIPNARCMTLNLAPQQMADPSVDIPVRATPRTDAPTIGSTGATVIVREGSLTNGFVEVMLANGRTGWMEANSLRPWAPRPGTQATCRPAVLSNGRFGFDIR